uniref:Uncharacterized protein n=1 Tax=Ciona savignyi TaxID=51511 RepID=H2ZFF7_CIOSA
MKTNSKGRFVPKFGKKPKCFQPPVKNVAKCITTGTKKKNKFDMLFRTAGKGQQEKTNLKKHKFDSLFSSASSS